ncbi:glycogen debranching N-terminal domain-containing protein [Phenylobacterium sp.]|jgi:glycogen debranching enzyme|uniref:amylo-alpha-1,6-glucosidase n=1 Tax=Phenylobacterium sp. TaxID=1871053 RepID=UPI002E3329B5|nr:glycogen debranching N-terminal domain-containing protein [Phenylobacterium sp.]HEX3367636.1 glycogen debranching N-terminal domain-containing protein [Phenylobacterium sp.]
MALEVAVGPQKLVLNQGSGFAVTDQDGQINWPTDKGVYYSDTRMISSWRIYADGVPWDLLNSGNIAFFAARIFLANRKLTTQTGEIEAQTLGLTIGRTLEGGLHEDLDLVNHGATTAQFNLEIAMRSDFADLFEVKSGNIVRRGRVTTSWSKARQTLATSYANKDFHRRLTVQVRNADSPAVYANGRLSFDIRIAPGATWHACLLYAFSDDHTKEPAPRACIEHCLQSKSANRLADWEAKSLTLNTDNQEFYRFYHQSLEDMGALRLPLEGTDHLEFVPAAGIPWFVGLFGRDSLIVSLQNAMVYPDFPRGSLEVLGRWQARKRDDYRDAEPGKIMHELRTGELAHFKMIPHTPYYGTADATPLYLIVLHNAWRSTGDDGLLERHMATAERCLAWIDNYGDRDRDGFQEYQTRSSAGYENQGWKDSGEALVYPDGSLVKGPKALCELQGYVYDAWRRMAEIYDALGKPRRAANLRTKASNLYRRFNEAFWDEESGFYAFCLDGEKKPVLSVASNPGHCLWSGIVPRDRAARVVRRLMESDMWSGWGIRTLSANHPAFNPHSYQNGSVWPHDNGLIALGFRRYGFADEAAMIARDISRAASYFQQHRMPELYAGLQRTPTNFPVQYLGANVPQAWAAGSCFWLLQAMLGFQPDAPAGKLHLDPALPKWMPDLRLENLQVGRRSFDIRFTRQGDGKTAWEVLKGDGRAVSERAIATYGGEDEAAAAVPA